MILITLLEENYISVYYIEIKYNYKYRNVTREWLDNATPNIGKIIKRFYYVDKLGIRYDVDGKDVVFAPSDDEIDMAKFILNTFGGNVYLNPKINVPNNVKSSDFLWRNQFWDKKTIGKEAKSFKRAIDNSLKKSKGQADYFILDISECIIPEYKIIEQTKKIFLTSGREWIKGIMIVKNNQVIRIYCKAKKEANPHPSGQGLTSNVITYSLYYILCFKSRLFNLSI